MNHMLHWLRTHVTLNRALLVLFIIAVVLSAITYIVVFYGGGTYVVNSPLPTSTVALGTASSTASSTATSTATSTLGLASSTATSTATSTVLASYASTYDTPPITWQEGYDTLSITNASLSGSELTLTLDVQMGTIAECVPLNVRLVTNEMGALEAPLENAFTFGENGTCIGTPGTNYPGQQVIFTVDPASMPLSFTTGGTSNKYFELSTTASGGIVIYLPSTQG